MQRYLSVFIVLMSASCNLYLNDDDDDCRFGIARQEDALQVVEHRNPYTGQCESFDFDCDDPCLCPVRDQQAPEAPPTWGYCYSDCSSLDEYNCWAAGGCRAAYLDGGDEGQPAFYGCWEKDSREPYYDDCDGLDADACSTSDSCVAVHEDLCANAFEPSADSCLGNFIRCEAEPATCQGVQDCDDGERCTAGDEHCFSPCMPGETCPTVCEGYCVPML